MSIYKEKAAVFANIFGKLDSDSDDDDNVKQDQKQEQPNKKSSPKCDASNASPIIPEQKSQPPAANDETTPDTAPVVNLGGDIIELSSSSDSNSCDIVEVDSFTYTDPTPTLTNEEPKNADESSFFEDYEYKLRVNRSGRYERFSMTYKSRFCDSLKDLIAELAKSRKSLVLTRDGEPISLESSPHSLKLAPGDILDAIEVQQDWMKSNTAAQPEESSNQCIDTNIITLKLQDGNRKHSKEFKVALDEPMARLKQEYAKEFNIDISTMKLSFDGDVVSDDQTAEELDIDDGCVIDVLLPQTITYVAPPSPVDLVSPEKKKNPLPRLRPRARGGRRRR